jgi:hypothetical protein
MTETSNNPAGSVRCSSCGRVDSPAVRSTSSGAAAVGLWAAAGAIWAIGFALGATWPSFVAAVVVLVAMIYTLLYFFRRERACRHCGGRELTTAEASAP